MLPGGVLGLPLSLDSVLVKIRLGMLRSSGEGDGGGDKEEEEDGDGNGDRDGEGESDGEGEGEKSAPRPMKLARRWREAEESPPRVDEEETVLERDSRLYSRTERGRTTFGDARLRREKGGVVSYVFTESQFSEGSRETTWMFVGRRDGRGKVRSAGGGVELSENAWETGREQGEEPLSGEGTTSGLESLRTAGTIGCNAQRGIDGVGGTGDADCA